MNAKVKGITYALIGGTCWGLSGIVGKLLFDTRGLNAQWLVTARLIIGGLIMLLIAFLQKKEKIFDVWKNKKTACSMLLFAAVGMLACQLTYFLCVQYSNPATATVLQYTSPVMIMILCLFLDKKLPRIIDILVLIAVVVGVFLMSTHGDIHTLVISQKALLLGMIAAVTVVFYTVWPVSLLREFGSPSVIGWGMFLGGIMLAPFSKFWVLSGKWDGYTVILVGIVIIFGTVCAFTCYLKGVMYLGPVKSSLFSCMEPLVSTILTVTVLHQTFAMADLVGIAVIIISVTSLAVNDVIEEAKTQKKNQKDQTEQMEQKRMKKSEKRTKVYLLDRTKTADPVSFSSWKDFLPKERWEKTVRPVREEDRKTELAAWLLLYHALKEWKIPEESIRADGAYCYGEHGKPERKKKDVCFNLSHSGKYVMCVVSDVEVGCDIEKIQKVRWKLAKRFFSEGEYDILEKLKEENPGAEEELFTRFWVLRESYVKKTGEGLGTSLEGLDFSGISGYKGKKNGKALKERFFEWEYDGYRIAVCEEKDGEPELVVCSRTIDNCFL